MFITDNTFFESNNYFQGVYLSSFCCVLLCVFSVRFFLTGKETKVSVRLSCLDFSVFFYFLYLALRFISGGAKYYDSLIPSISAFIAYMWLKMQLTRASNRQYYSEFIFIVLVASAFLESSLGILQLLGFAKSKNDLYLLTGTFFNPAPFAIYLALVFPICIKQVNSNNPFIRFLAVVTVILIVICIVVSFSRTALLMLLVGFFLIFKKKLKLRFPKLSPLKAVLFTAISSVILIGSFFLFNAKRDSALGRLFIWKISATMFVENPVFGLGFHSFEEKYGNYLESYFSITTQKSKEVLLSDKVIYAFNDFIQLLVEQGMIGFLFIVLILYLLFTLKSQDSATKYVKVSLSLLVVSCTFSYPLEVNPIVFITVLFVSVLSSSFKQYVYTIPYKFVLLFYIVVFVVSILTGNFLYRNYEAKKMCSFANDLYVAGKIGEAKDILQKAYKVLQYDSKIVQLLAKVLYKSGQYEQSNDVLQEVKQYSSDPFLYIMEGDNYSMLGNARDAVNSYKIASNIDPKSIYPRYLLVNSLLVKGDTLHAIREAKFILNMKIKIRSEASEKMQAEMIEVSELKHKLETYNQSFYMD